MKHLPLFAAALLMIASCCTTTTQQTKAEDPLCNEVVRTIMARRSIRAYQTRPVDRDTMAAIISCGINAPSAMNRQSWEVRMIDDADFINGTTDLYVAQMKKDPRSAKMVEDPSFKNMYRNAPTLAFIACQKESHYSKIDCGLLTENMLLAAQSFGIGTCCLGNPVGWFSTPEAAPFYQKLDIPDTHELILVVAFGYPAESPDAKPRDEAKARWID